MAEKGELVFDNGLQFPLPMKPNVKLLIIYIYKYIFFLFSVNEYKVSIRNTDASERCDLKGMYLLKAEKDALILKSISPEQLVCEWPYKYLRRFGGDKVPFNYF